MINEARYHIAMLAPDDAIGSNVTGPFDVFKIANGHRIHNKPASPPLCRWSIVSPGGGNVRLNTGITIEVDGDLSCAENADVIMVPGIDYQGSGAFTETLRKQQGIIEWLSHCGDKGVLITSSCTGAFLLAEAGLLDGRRATTSWWAAHLFSRRYPQVIFAPENRLTEGESVICAGAASSYLNLAIKIVERLGGEKLANQCAKTISLDRFGSTQALASSQNNYRSQPDEVVSRAQVWMQRNLHEEINLDRVAAHLSISVRTLIRHFKASLDMTPTTYLQCLRVDTAKRLLELSKLKVDEVSAQVGYSDPSSFRRIFHRENGYTPSDYRKRFAKREAVIPIARRAEQGLSE